MTRRLSLFIFVASLAGCTTRDRASNAQAGENARPITSAVELRDAPVAELVAQLAPALGAPVIVEPDAMQLARCARLTMSVPAGTSRPELVSIATSSLAGVALAMIEEDHHFSISRLAGVELPRDCERALAAPTPRLPVGEPAVAPVPDGPIEGIRLIGENRYEFDPDAAVFEGGANALMSPARVIPHQVDGRVVGIKVYGVRRQSLIGRLGFQNGDLIKSVGGHDITAPDTALQAYAELRGTPQIVVEIERRGQPLRLTYVRQR